MLKTICNLSCGQSSKGATIRPAEVPTSPQVLAAMIALAGTQLPTRVPSYDILHQIAAVGYIVASNHAMVYVWDPKIATELRPVTKFRAHPVGSYCLLAKLSPDSRSLVRTLSDKSAKLWDTAKWELKSCWRAHTKWVWDAAFSADSRYLITASSDRTARLWNLRTGEVVKQYNGHPLAVTCVALNDSYV
jgi:WD40 repeat protein